jgi:hypothetical protein
MSDYDSSEDIPLADLAATARVQRDIQQSETRIEEMAKRRRLQEPVAASSAAEQVWAFISGATSSGEGANVMASVMSESDKAEYYAKLKQLDKSGLAAYKFAATSWWTDADIKRSTTTTERRTMKIPMSIAFELGRLRHYHVRSNLPRNLIDFVSNLRRGNDDKIVIETGRGVAYFQASYYPATGEQVVYCTGYDES